MQYVKNVIADRVMDEVIEQVLRDEEVRRLLDDPEVRRALREAVAEEDLERLRVEIGAKMESGGSGSAIGGAEGGISGGSVADSSAGAGFLAAGPEAGGDLTVLSLEEAEALVLKKFSIGEIRRYAAMARGGLTDEEKRLIRDEALGRFTEDEWRALQVAALIEAERRSGAGE
jgi:hypothetical protein